MLIGRYSVILDACVLHPAHVRGALLWFAHERLFRPRWSDDIMAEWTRSLKRRFPDFSEEMLSRNRTTMDAHFPDANVEGYGRFVDVLDMPDPDDRHVLAAAIVGKADAIVTYNVKHFPPEIAERYRLDIRHPDDFIVNVIDLEPSRALSALRRQRDVLRNPPFTAEQFLDKFRACGLIQSHQRLMPHVDLL